ncbi:mitochondrial fission ELM1 family protein [Kozakia baliensis]|uniref:mitochondrial fission ELM1 family protein n=1 Tax=Kozakia baliensis TaxID=153496 RepID=UPI00087A3784|nr:mitochondrial fission ELM1 family protein [Kozakia baliensis]AOX21221.1 hypothetical protein A0U90_05410 [Kozakia baliensis]
MSVAIIAEDFAGMRAQASGLAERAGLDWHFHAVKMRGPWAKLPARFCPNPLAAMDRIDLPPKTTLLMSVGGTGGVAAAALKRRTGLKLVQIQNPRMSFSRFDLIVANCHDGISGSNVVLCRNALHGMTPEKLAPERSKWSPILRRPEHKLVSVLIGGANGRFRFGIDEAATLADGLAAMMTRDGVQIALTPSRRTDPQALAVLRTVLSPLGAFIWDGEGDNPYRGLLACADLIVVTMDSVSMVSEAVSTTAPVMIVELPGRSKRISAFIRTLQEAGRVKPFIPRWAFWPVTPLDDTPMAAGEMRRRLAI